MILSVHYVAYLEYADEPFDSSRKRNNALKFDLGATQFDFHQLFADKFHKQYQFKIEFNCLCKTL